MKDEDPPKKNVDPNQIRIVTKHVTKTSKNLLKYSTMLKKKKKQTNKHKHLRKM